MSIRIVLILGATGVSIIALGVVFIDANERGRIASARRETARSARIAAERIEESRDTAPATIVRILADTLAGSGMTASYHTIEGDYIAGYPALSGPGAEMRRRAIEAATRRAIALIPPAEESSTGLPALNEIATVRSARWERGKPVSLVRVARDRSSIDAESGHLGRLTLAAALIACGSVWGIVSSFERSLRRSVGEISRAVASLEEGRRTRPVASGIDGSLRPLATLVDAAFPRLEERIDALERDRRQLGAVLSVMEEGVMAVDARRRLLFANAGANRLFGLSSGSVGRLVPELIRSPQIQDVVEATLAGPDPYKGQIALASLDGLPRVQARLLAVHGTLLPGPPPSAAVLVFHDITELRRLERMRQDFVANASHELKTPLASIKAYTETLIDWALKDDKVNIRFLKHIDEQADRLNQLILDMLSLARLESGQDPFRHGPLDVIPAARERVESHRGRAEAKRLSYGMDEIETGDRSLYVRADEEAIRQILDNLIDNAIKYTPEGGSVRVSCRSARDPDQVVIEVTDSGIGIPREDISRIFERFYRVDKARSRELGGTGLGLSIVKHIAQTLGGSVTVASRVGAGSRFTVRLPSMRAPT